MELNEALIRTGHPPHTGTYKKNRLSLFRILRKIALFVIVFVLSFHLPNFIPSLNHREQTIREIREVLERHPTGLANVTKEEIAEVIYEEAQRHNQDPKFILALISIESEFKNWSVSAILVEPDSVWLALQRRGEYGNQSGGVLRWDRRSQQVVRYDSPSVIHALARDGESLYAGTEDGLAVLRGRGFQPYFIDVTLAGAYAVMPRECGEPSPSSR